MFLLLTSVKKWPRTVATLSAFSVVDILLVENVGKDALLKLSLMGVLA